MTDLRLYDRVKARWRQLMCLLSLHRQLDVIQSFGSAQHIGCPDCGREFGIHHGERVVIPWTPDLAAMYESMGIDVETPSTRWRRYCRNMQRAETAS